MAAVACSHCMKHAKNNTGGSPSNQSKTHSSGIINSLPSVSPTWGVKQAQRMPRLTKNQSIAGIVLRKALNPDTRPRRPPRWRVISPLPAEPLCGGFGVVKLFMGRRDKFFEQRLELHHHFFNREMFKNPFSSGHAHLPCLVGITN